MAFRIIGMCLIFLCTYHSLEAQQASTELTKIEKDALLLKTGRLLEKFYVFPEKGKQINEILQEQVKNGKFDSIKDPRAFRKEAQDAIRAVVDDQHLRIIYLQPREESTNANSQEELISALKLEYEKRKEMNFGIPEVKVLEGNMGYMNITKFTAPELMGPVMRAASLFLKNTDGLIIDLRSRGGGKSDAVVLLLSYFLPPETAVFYWEDRYGKELERNWTHPYVDGYKFNDIPIAVLTSTKTFSGSEAMAYMLKHHSRATVIGEKTRGGAHTYKEILLSEKYLLLLPHERGVSAKTKTNWEGVGVQPDIFIDSENALEEAKKWLMDQLQKEGEK